MQDGTPISAPRCGRCKQTIEIAVRTDAVYQEGIWFHTACHREGADQLFRARRLSDVLKEIKRGVEIITSPLFQGEEPPGVHTDEREEMSAAPSARWLPRIGEHYFLMLGNGRIARFPWNDTDFDRAAWHFGNCFHTQAQAAQAREAITEVLRTLHQSW